ncbi:MAG: sigma-54 dependent transcriptional regulator [Nitrospiraceae bacterium]|nr:sigma-54 dependent transcriptional regulator [Nitrospiraceae bacterium]MDA8325013.1 sigma-54 dependent transcriptional regulator [Nitrospiraceae bacterium]
MAVILVVDDEPLQRDILTRILSDAGYEAHAAGSGEEALEMARALDPDVILTDLKMKRMNGIELMERMKSENELSMPAMIIMTAFGSVSSAVEAMKKGAFDYISKPLEKEMVLLTIKRAVNMVEILKKNRELQSVLYNKFGIEGIIGDSMWVKDVINLVKKVNDSPVTVLILGESGTGKELVARAIHYSGTRSTKPFTAINCASIPESLLESELFGYEPGAFTGASSRRTGLFEATNGGTVFLDEIGDLPPAIQSKILRVLQEKELRRLGGRETIKVDVKIIAATNKDLEKEIKSGRFREDLYYRLRIVTIELPPLRERKEDIPELVGYFLEKYNKEFGRRIKKVNESVLRAFADYHWPGNVRQLEAVVERAVLICDTDTIMPGDIKGELRSAQRGQAGLDIEIPEEGISFDELEKELLRKAMAKAGGVAARAAKLLGMSYKTFWYRWEKLSVQNSSPKKEEVS